MSALLVFQLFLAPLVSPGYGYDTKRQKYFYGELYYSPPSCQDHALVLTPRGGFAISLCGGSWQIFGTQQTPYELEALAREWHTTLYYLRDQEYLWYFPLEDRDRLLYLNPKGIAEIRDFRTMEGGWLISLKGDWYLIYAIKESHAQVHQITPMPSLQEGMENPWLYLSSAGYLPGQGLLALIFYYGGQKTLALYGTQDSRWYLHPVSFLWREEKAALQAGKNVIFRLALSPAPNRIYYTILRGGEEVGRTEIHNEGENGFFAMSLPEGRHVFQVKRYRSQQGKGGTHFALDKNILQPEPVSVNLLAGQNVLLFLRKGRKEENKAYVLDYTYLGHFLDQ
ncbi:MAG: hypothetical protein NZM25_05920 [Leptospiraceae bacterium]|nr:hypothetical protein [Leptospiraceae bacterium]MDW8306688.1 hypothetical protein [Leptospiraceae bacterium]